MTATTNPTLSNLPTNLDVRAASADERDTAKRALAGGATAGDWYPTASAGYREVQLRRALDLIVDRKDWRAPIFALVRIEDARPDSERASAARLLLAAACEWYTATKPTIEVEEATSGDAVLVMRAAGYRAGPAGDH